MLLTQVNLNKGEKSRVKHSVEGFSRVESALLLPHEAKLATKKVLFDFVSGIDTHRFDLGRDHFVVGDSFQNLVALLISFVIGLELVLAGCGQDLAGKHCSVVVLGFVEPHAVS